MTPSVVAVSIAVLPVTAVTVWCSITIAVSRSPWSIASVATLGVLAVAANVDRREFRLPDALVGLAATPLVAVVFMAPAAGAPVVAASAVAGAMVAGAPIGVVHLVAPTSMGFGDVKAAAVLGGAVGVVEWRLALVAICAAAAAAAVSALVLRRRTVALGPFLVGGAFVVLALAGLSGPEALPWR
jgi:leader peptidase (prepilin peptidase) / N-methyltransferase